MTAGLLVAIMSLALCVQMALYIPRKLGGKGKAYTLTKLAGSLIFTATAISSVFFVKPDGYAWLVIAASVLASVGDYFLSLQNGHHRLRMGAASFICAHCFLVAGFASVADFHWQTLAVAAVQFLIEVLLACIIKLNCRGAWKGVAVYIAVVTTMAAFAGSIWFYGGMPAVPAAMTAVGGVLFLISDMLWVLYGLDKQSPRKLVKALNVVTYFPAMFLIAAALLFR